MKKIHTAIAILFLLIASFESFGQGKKELLRLESYMHASVSKGHPATVLINGYDIKTKTKTGSRFSGVVIDKEGRILTAAHACTPNQTYLVTFQNGKEFTATGLGGIRRIDVAIMKINELGTWAYAEMGWSSSLAVNEPVISIAYPGSFMDPYEVIRAGYVAELNAQRGRRFRSTCLMEPGDSGGPVFDLFGRVVGIHSSIDLALENNYEVPVDLFRKYWSALQKPEAYVELPSADSVTIDPMLARKPIFSEKGISGFAFPDLESKFEKLALKVSSQVDDSVRTILGTVISAGNINVSVAKKGKGYLVSKSSMVGSNPLIELASGKTHPAKVIKRSMRKDLVLLEVDLDLGKGISFGTTADSISFNDLGSLIVSPQPGKQDVWSVIGTTRINLRGVNNAGYLGAVVERQNDKLVLVTIQPNSPAQRANLTVGQEIVSLNGMPFLEPQLFVKEVQSNFPNDTLNLVTNVGNGINRLKIPLAKRPAIMGTHIAEKFLDGKSERRDGFLNAFVHDGKLKPSECGGPIFDLEGKFLGINMARFSRTSSIAVNETEIISFLKDL
ncbi:S1 family peptidase [Pedobacter sp. PWIIR3]